MHEGLRTFKIVKGATEEEVELKATLQSLVWAERWQKVEKGQALRRDKEHALIASSQRKEWANKRTRECQGQIGALSRILKDSVELDHRTDWDSLKDRKSFGISPPSLSK